jgi:integrase
VQNIIKLCLLTGQRVGEVARVDSDELDGKKRLWTIPPERSKNKLAHTVPLTDGAIELARVISKGPKLSTHAVDHTIRHAQGRFGLDQWTPHDLRRTVATNMGKLGVPPIVVAAILNHASITKAGVTLGVYQHYDYAAEKRDAIELWENRLQAIVAGDVAKVVPLRKTRSA